ncbi:hypothetical protein QTN47_17755 [Danxiaibacter flavus]|uniref:Uncharacterized protein n=1 Tax=Danxiaibacter flavus TaxID=3049108 RepID=A0ABV3ZLL5_9BACT|nr:hypothetical protein QNM32_17765 [Chitinophagaceae bacterium DXS]
MRIQLTFFALAMLVLTLPVKGLTQTRPFNGANKIIASFNGNSDSLMKKILTYFADKGYAVEAVDKNSGVIKTGEKSPMKTLVSVKISAIVKDNTIIFTGLRKSRNGNGPTIGQDFREITCGGIWSSEQKDAWDELNKVAQGIKPTAITYAKN